MFTQDIIRVLDEGHKTEGWGVVSRKMGMTSDNLRTRLMKNQCSFEELIDILRESRSLELLNIVFKRIDPAYGDHLMRPN